VNFTLTKGGYQVIEAEDGADGIEKLKANKDVAMVISDVNMPNMNGLEMVEKLKAEGNTVPVIMLTTEGAPDLIQRAKAAGAKGWLVKPFQPDQLVAAAPMSEKEDTSDYLVSFLARYTLLLEGQLLNIREMMVSTVEFVMQGVAGLSSTTEDRRQDAENALVMAHVNPDMETEILIQDVQKVVDEIFDETSDRHDKGQAVGDPLSAEPEVLVRNRISRFAGRFATQMNALNAVDDELRNVMLGIVGALSSEDVIAQKLEHVMRSLVILQTGLSYVLIDFDQRCTVDELEKVTTDIKSYTFRQYTTKDEKKRFLAIFADETKKTA
jgi:two-component system chemotaxis response regulator CheY